MPKQAHSSPFDRTGLFASKGGAPLTRFELPLGISWPAHVVRFMRNSASGRSQVQNDTRDKQARTTHGKRRAATMTNHHLSLVSGKCGIPTVEADEHKSGYGSDRGRCDVNSETPWIDSAFSSPRPIALNRDAVQAESQGLCSNFCQGTENSRLVPRRGPCLLERTLRCCSGPAPAATRTQTSNRRSSASVFPLIAPANTQGSKFLVVRSMAERH